VRRSIAVSLLLLFSFIPVPGHKAQEVQVATTIAFTEGPTADAAGNVFFTDQANNRIMKLAADGKLSTFRQPANYANGLVFDPQWRLLACESGDPAAATPARLTRTDLKTGKLEVLVDKYDGKNLVAPNDVTFDGKGRIYFSDKPAKNTGEGGVYRIDLDGRVTRILAPPEIEVPNGLIISPDDKTFYLIEANGAEKGARVIRAYDLRADGTVTGMRVFHNFYPGRSGDGMSVDVKGNLYVAAGLHRRRGTSETLDTKPGIHVFSRSGDLLKFIPIPEDLVTNCAFGGEDMKTLYVTAGKTLFKVRTEIEGTRR
jgi:gluconolactonase